MPSTPTTRLRVETQALGENLNTWGDTRLNEALKRLEEGIAGMATIPIAGTSTTLTSVNYSSDQARNACLVFTGALTANSVVIVPNVEKIYLAVNLTSGAFSLTLKTAAGSGYALRAGPQWVRCDGADVLSATPRLDQAPLPTAAMDFNGQRLTNIPTTPAALTDAASKSYVDTVAGGAASQYFPADGSAAAPAYSFAADTNTGIWRAGTDHLGVSTGGVSRLEVDATGNIGAGMTPMVVADKRILSLKGASTGDGSAAIRLETGINTKQAFWQVSGANGDVAIGTSSGNATGGLGLWVNEAARLQIEPTAGNVSVGTTPTVLADHRIMTLKGLATGDGVASYRLEQGTTSKQAFWNCGANGDVGFGAHPTNNAAGTLSLWAAGAISATFGAGGNVGIGRPPTGAHALELYRAGASFQVSQRWANDTVTMDAYIGGGAGVIGTTTAHPFWIATGNQQRITIAATGELYGVGATTHISGTPGALNGRFTAGVRWALRLEDPGTTNGVLAAFVNGNGHVGQISVSGTTTTYSTASDYRLKENVEPLSDALARVAQLRPSRFNFKADPGRRLDGFIAHEVEAICPEAVVGEKDGEMMQSIDPGKLIPLMAGAIQELAERVASLEAR